jgi:hypothetical protein
MLITVVVVVAALVVLAAFVRLLQRPARKI